MQHIILSPLSINTLHSSLVSCDGQIREIIVNDDSYSLGSESGIQGAQNFNCETHIEEEEAYVVPGCDEHSLSKQFSKFKIQNLHKNAIR